jgi:hypothetical protein
VVDMPYTGTDKRRGGDSGVLLAAVIDYLVGVRPCWTGFTVRPHVPRTCRRISVAGLRLPGGRLDVEAGRWGSRVSYRGCELARLLPGAGLAWDAASGSAKRLERKGGGA